MVAGVLLVTAVQGWSTTGVGGLREAIAVPVLVGLGLLLRDRLRDASYAVTGIGVLTWVLLAANGVSRGLQAQTRAEFWNGFDGWPLLVAAGYAALVASVRTLTPEVRAIAAGSTLVGLSLLVLLPGEWTTREVLLLAAVVLAFAALTRFAPAPWSTAASVLGGTVAAGAAAATVLLPAGLALHFADQHEPWSTAPDDPLPDRRRPVVVDARRPGAGVPDPRRRRGAARRPAAAHAAGGGSGRAGPGRRGRRGRRRSAVVGGRGRARRRHRGRRRRRPRAAAVTARWSA